MSSEVIEMEKLTIGQVAKLAGIKIETIRYYERLKLLPEPKRRQSGYREYTDDTVKRLQFIKNAKELGFSLKEISELLSLRVKPKSTCGGVKKRTDNKITEIDSKIKTLQKMRKALVKLSKACKGDGSPTSECPILEAIDSSEKRGVK